MRPNILFLFTDQMRFDAIAAHGNPVIKTPNLDRLIQRGVTFDNAYTPSPVCIAARCSLHYGQYPTNTDCYANDPMPEDGRPSYADVLTQAGYRTHAIGKCHFSPNFYDLRGYESREYQEEGFSSDKEKETYMQALLDNGFDYAIEPNGIRSEMYYIPQPSRLPQRLHPTQWIGDRSIEFIEKNKGDQPWYLFSSFIHPHPPFAPPSPWHMLYRTTDMPLPDIPENLDDLLILINKIQNRYKYRDRGIDENLLRTLKAYYYACVSFVDYQIGRIMNTLESTGQLENTVILFSSDHGELLGDYHCFGKRSMHNGAARIPLIVSGGEFTGGKICSTPVSLIDVAPTLLNIAGADAGTMRLDGVDLLSVARDECHRKGVFSFFSSHGEVEYTLGRHTFAEYTSLDRRYFSCMNMMYAEKDLKYMYSAPDNKELLFDETGSREELENLALRPEYSDKLSYMRGTLIDYLKSVGHTEIIQEDGFAPILSAELPAEPDAGLIRQDFRPPYFDFSVIDDYI